MTQIGQVGKTLWAIAEGYIPSDDEQDRRFVSHETACILNTTESEAHIEIVVYFIDRAPIGPYRIDIPAQRTKHLRFNDLKSPEVIPRDTDYSCVLRSDVPVVVQHTRLDSRRSNLALLSTTAYAQ